MCCLIIMSLLDLASTVPYSWFQIINFASELACILLKEYDPELDRSNHPLAHIKIWPSLMKMPGRVNICPDSVDEVTNGFRWKGRINNVGKLIETHKPLIYVCAGSSGKLQWSTYTCVETEQWKQDGDSDNKDISVNRDLDGSMEATTITFHNNNLDDEIRPSVVNTVSVAKKAPLLMTNFTSHVGNLIVCKVDTGSLEPIWIGLMSKVLIENANQDKRGPRVRWSNSKKEYRKITDVLLGQLIPAVKCPRSHIKEKDAEE